MKCSFSTKVVVVGLLGLTLLGAASPKTARQIEDEKEALRRDLAILRRCGHAQIRSGEIPQRMFNRCAEVYQQFGMTLFPDHGQDSSSDNDAGGDSVENTAVSSSSSSLSSAGTSLSSVSSSSQMSAGSSSMVTGGSSSLTSTGSSSSVSSVAPTPFPTQTSGAVPSPAPSIVYAKPTIGLSPDGGSGVQPIS